MGSQAPADYFGYQSYHYGSQALRMPISASQNVYVKLY